MYFVLTMACGYPDQENIILDHFKLYTLVTVHEKTRYIGHFGGNEAEFNRTDKYANSRIKYRRQNCVISNRF